MNPEVHKIIEHMQKLAPPAQVQVSDYDRVHTYQMLNMARLMVLLAEEQEKTSAKLEQLTTRLISQTDRLINFTKGPLLAHGYTFGSWRCPVHRRLCIPPID
jgi:hypothetical protein